MSLDGLWTTPETSSTLSVIHFRSRRNSRARTILPLFLGSFCLTTLKDHLQAATVCGIAGKELAKVAQSATEPFHAAAPRFQGRLLRPLEERGNAIVQILIVNAQLSILGYGTTTLTSSNRLLIPRFPRSTSYRDPSREPGGISRTICRLDSTIPWP
jgi:23S rRNA C2498 (ribose-2'-O)-methylase RlmM